MRLALVLVLIVACGSDGRLAPPTATGPSNILAADYIGPAACGECHPTQLKTWRTSLHATMTRDVDDAPVLGDFGGATLAYAGGHARFDGAGSHRTMTLTSATGVVRRFRVTRTIGSRNLQEYVGVQERGPEPAGDPVYALEQRLPFGLWRRAGRWLPQPYFDSWFGPELDATGAPTVDVFAPTGEPWAARCAWCHNTYPFELRAVRELVRPVGYGHERAVALRAPTRDAAAVRAIGRDNLLPLGELVTVGISCESCHLGGRDHADDAPISFRPQSPLLVGAAAPDSGRRDPRVLAATCGQCHSTPAATFPSGAVARNSAESTDQASGACTSQLRCVDCHDPHVVSTDDRAALEARAVAACVRCHPALAGADAQRAHAGHAPEVATCLDCHTPRLVQGLDRQTRSHHIGSPTDVRMLAAGAPNACNLCHLDQSIAWTVANLNTQFGTHLATTPALAAAYGGDLDAPVGPAWLAAPQRDTRLAAAAAYGRQGGAAAVARLLPYLDAPVAYERMWLLFAVEAALGHAVPPSAYDPLAPPAVRATQLDRFRAVAQ